MKQVENNKTKEHKNNNGGNNNFLYIIKAYSKNISVFSAFLYGIAMVNKNIYLYLTSSNEIIKSLIVGILSKSIES